MKNWQKWALALATGFLGGIIIAATHDRSGLRDYVRDGLIGMAPTVGALNLTLKRELGVSEESSKAASA